MQVTAVKTTSPPQYGPPGQRLARYFFAARDSIAGITLISPAVILTLIGLILPLVIFLLRSAENPEVPAALPRTVEILRQWDGQGLPSDAAFAALATDLAEASANGKLGDLARRMNFQTPGYRTLFFSTGNRLEGRTGVGRQELIEMNRRWGEPEVWLNLRLESRAWTDAYYLAALDRKRTPQGEVQPVDEGRKLFVNLFLRTFVISVSVTLLCLLLGYPAAYVLASASVFWTPVLLVMVLLPFWTSTLVRSTAWIVLLQNSGLFNSALQWLGLTDSPLPMFGNRFAVLVAMTHVLLPYMIMPIYGAMKAVPPNLMLAATSLGAPPHRVFLRVYLPQTLPGVIAGSLLVFILALGYYVTPALVGGPSDQMVSYFIALYTNETLNWGFASALGCLLLGLTAICYALFSRVGPAKVGVR